MGYLPRQLVQDFFHQQYFELCWVLAHMSCPENDGAISVTDWNRLDEWRETYRKSRQNDGKLDGEFCWPDPDSVFVCVVQLNVSFISPCGWCFFQWKWVSLKLRHFVLHVSSPSLKEKHTYIQYKDTPSTNHWDVKWCNVLQWKCIFYFLHW